MEKYKIGIIGGSGYLGTSLARHLEGKFSIRILDIREPPDDLRSSFRYCDVRMFGEVMNALKDLDLVMHVAAVQIPFINEQMRLGYDVNFVGTQNVCEAVDKSPCVKGMILASSWHAIGERELKGRIGADFEFRRDEVEDRTRVYALSKIGQECAVRYFDEMSDKIFGIIRMGTLLGEGMNEKTAAGIFINQALKGETLTPFRHSMYRPMLCLDIEDACVAFERFASLIIEKQKGSGDRGEHVFNVFYPGLITIVELAKIIQEETGKLATNIPVPQIEIVDKKQSTPFSRNQNRRTHIDIGRSQEVLGLTNLRHPRQTIHRILKRKLESMKSRKTE
jgi:UDP-glucose 4-epimerase